MKTLKTVLRSFIFLYICSFLHKEMCLQILNSINCKELENTSLHMPHKQPYQDIHNSNQSKYGGGVGFSAKRKNRFRGNLASICLAKKCKIFAK